MPYKGCRIKGKYGTYVLKSQIGHGGNGVVYEIEIVDKKEYFPYDDRKFVIKILAFSKRNSFVYEKRRRRFEREIRTVQQLTDSNLNIVPIIDSYLDEEKTLFEWYVMPKAQEYKFKEKDCLTNLKQLRDLGNTLQILHEKGIFHRDIKPSNILFYKNKCCLTDFGLVWNSMDYDHITAENEAVGPIVIRPPEMEHSIDNLNENIDMQKVDSYLFAKTVWIMLTGYFGGFRGQYQRGDRAIYLDRNKIPVGETIEPLHKMMEEATKYLNKDRIIIKECVQYINQQIAIAECQIPNIDISALKQNEIISEIRAQIPTDIVVHNEINKIHQSLCKMEKNFYAFINDFGEEILLGEFYLVQLIQNNLFCITIRNKFPHGNQKMRRKIYISIEEIRIGEDATCQILTQKYDIIQENIATTCSIKELQNCHDLETGLNGQFQIVLKSNM